MVLWAYKTIGLQIPSPTDLQAFGPTDVWARGPTGQWAHWERGSPGGCCDGSLRRWTTWGASESAVPRSPTSQGPDAHHIRNLLFELARASGAAWPLQTRSPVGPWSLGPSGFWVHGPAGSRDYGAKGPRAFGPEAPWAFEPAFLRARTARRVGGPANAGDIARRLPKARAGRKPQLAGRRDRAGPASIGGTFRI
jgi:hypothetical protein